MESSSATSRYAPQNSSKKRVFPGGTSSSSSSPPPGFNDVEVLEIPPPPITHRSKASSSSKQKQVISCETIIDVDMDDDVMLIDDIGTSVKGKDFFPCFQVGHSAIKSTAIDDFSPNVVHVEDEYAWLDTYYDDIIFDDFHNMDSHFDHMDIPPGVEAPFPWLPGSLKNDGKMPTTKTLSDLSSHVQSAGVGHFPGMESVYPGLPKIGQVKNTSSSSNKSADVHTVRGKSISNLADNIQWHSTPSNSQSFLSSKAHGSHSVHAAKAESLHGKSKRRSHAIHELYSQYQPALKSPNVHISASSYLTTPKPGSGLTVMPMWDDMDMFFEPFPGFMGEGAVASQANYPANNQNSASPIASIPASVNPKNVDEILQKFNVFKKFDTVEDCSDHHYFKSGSVKQPPKNWAKRIQEEWKILESDLPDQIFVRVYESRMDLLRAVIVGAEGTPYHDGLYFFDVHFPSCYPSVPPHVHYHSGGLRINPNLYNDGKVCLSLLNTWSGSHKEKWIPGHSTMLQVLVSIQGLILNAKPYFNEPGYEHSAGSVHGEKSALDYNERTFMLSLQTMLYNIRRPPKHFEGFVAGHFYKHGRDILVCCKAYMDGAQVGCLAKGGVQDVDEGDKSCSPQFKNNLARLITSVVDAFTQVGVKDCDEFRSLAQKATGPPNGPTNPFRHHASQFFYP